MINFNIKTFMIVNHRISFTTLPALRAALMEQAKALYSEFSGALAKYLSEKSINSIFPNEPQGTQRARRFFRHVSVFSVLSVVFTFRISSKIKKKLRDGYDPTRREPKEKLQAEFNASIGKLAPLLKRIEATDGFIDQIVYKLYGLTEDEMKIVEESIS